MHAGYIKSGNYIAVSDMASYMASYMARLCGFHGLACCHGHAQHNL